jgi:hypothetical protein
MQLPYAHRAQIYLDNMSTTRNNTHVCVVALHAQLQHFINHFPAPSQQPTQAPEGARPSPPPTPPPPPLLPLPRTSWQPLLIIHHAVAVHPPCPTACTTRHHHTSLAKLTLTLTFALLPCMLSSSISSKSLRPVSSRHRPQKVPPPTLLPLTRVCWPSPGPSTRMIDTPLPMLTNR